MNVCDIACWGSRNLMSCISGTARVTLDPPKQLSHSGGNTMKKNFVSLHFASRLGALILIGAIIAPLAAADWPCWLGPQRNGSSPETGLLTTWPKEGPEAALEGRWRRWLFLRRGRSRKGGHAGAAWRCPVRPGSRRGHRQETLGDEDRRLLTKTPMATVHAARRPSMEKTSTCSSPMDRWPA